MFITKEMFLGSTLYAVSYKGQVAFNRDIRKAIAQILSIVNNQ